MRSDLHINNRIQPWRSFLDSVNTCKTLYNCNWDHEKEGEKKECNSNDQPSNTEGNIRNRQV